MTTADTAEAITRRDRTRRLRRVRDALQKDLVERDLAVRLALLAALAGEHLLLVGPPGTAKSLVARRLRGAFAGSTFFERLLTRFTVPEELFGPLSIKALEQDRYHRQVEGYLPTAQVAFLDEIFKANSAILNALLTLLNERLFDNGVERVATPLIAVIGASNELPEDGELDALADRFLLRLHVGPVSDDGFDVLLDLRGEPPTAVPAADALDHATLAALRDEAETVDLPTDVRALLKGLRKRCAELQIPVSDRRWRKVVKLLQVAALSCGREIVSVWDCWLLQHCLWHTPEQREALYAWYAERVGASGAMNPERLTRIIEAWEGQLKKDKESRTQCRDAKGQPLWLGADGKPTTKSQVRARKKRGSMDLFLAPAAAHGITDRTNGGNGYTQSELNGLHIVQQYHYGTQFQHWDGRAAYLLDKNNWLLEEAKLQPILEPTRHPAEYIDARLQEIAQTNADIATYAQKLDAHITSLEEQILAHLWIADDFVEPATRSLKQTWEVVRTLAARAERLARDYRALPRAERVAIASDA